MGSSGINAGVHGGTIWDDVRLTTPEFCASIWAKTDRRSMLYFGDSVKYPGPYIKILYNKLTGKSASDLAFQKKFKALTEHPNYRQDNCLSEGEVLLYYTKSRKYSFWDQEH